MRHRFVRAAVIATGLIGAAGGTAALADAASSSTPAAKPSATPPAARSGKPHNGKDCPNMGGDSSNGASYGAPDSGPSQPSV